jgi:AraC-like DNA-binding protein
MRVFHEIRKAAADDPHGVTTIRTDSLSFMAHWHHDLELILVRAGEIPVSIDGQTYRMRAGDLAIVGGGDIHSYEGGTGGCDMHVVIVPPGLLGQGHWPIGFRFPTPFFTEHEDAGTAATRMPAEVMSALRAQLMAIVAEAQIRDIAHDDMLRGHIRLFCGMAARLLPTASATEAGERKRLEQVMRVQTALEWLETHYRSDVTLADLARRMNMSYHHLSRLFGETVGTSFRQHLNRLRVNEADRLLAGSTLSITDIALHCGFNSLRTFNRAYQALRGQTPSSTR